MTFGPYAGTMYLQVGNAPSPNPKGLDIMARQASKFDNHQTLGAFGTALEATEGLEVATETVIASDIVKDADGKTDEKASRSGEVTIPVYTATTLEAALSLYGGSEKGLIDAAVNALNSANREAAKRHIVTTIEGPEKVVEKVLARLAKHFDTEVSVLRKKVDENPAYLDMLLNLAK